MSYDPIYDFQPHPADRTIADLRVQLTEAAAFLDGLADRIEDEIQGDLYVPLAKAAADCRAMAKKLRGET